MTKLKRKFNKALSESKNVLTSVCRDYEKELTDHVRFLSNYPKLFAMFKSEYGYSDLMPIPEKVSVDDFIKCSKPNHLCVCIGRVNMLDCLKLVKDMDLKQIELLAGKIQNFCSPDKDYYWYKFCYELTLNKNLNIFLVRKYNLMDNKFRADNVSKNEGLTLDDIKDNPDLPWNLHWVSNNPNVTKEFLQKHKNIEWTKIIGRETIKSNVDNLIVEGFS